MIESIWLVRWEYQAAPVLLILLAVLVYGWVHSWLATLSVKAWVRRRFGERAERVYRLAYNIFALASLIPVIALPALLPDRPLYQIPFPWTLITSGLQVLAAVALIAGVLQTGLWHFLGVRQLFSPDGEHHTELKVTGLYRWVRHPLYTAGLVFIWCVPIMTLNMLALNVGLTAYIFAGARLEERRLLQEFGQAYAHYRRGTPMLIPFRFGGAGVQRTHNGPNPG